jgi:hypothetical protein
MSSAYKKFEREEDAIDKKYGMTSHATPSPKKTKERTQKYVFNVHHAGAIVRPFAPVFLHLRCQTVVALQLLLVNFLVVSKYRTLTNKLLGDY